jgi:release factor glutamine methyltransferase
MLLKDIANHFNKTLAASYGEEEVNAIFLLVVEKLLNYRRAEYLLKKLENCSAEVEHNFESILNELKTGKPIQYILEQTKFYGLPFKVNPSVLIPRPETEELVAWILETTAVVQDLTVLDIGTGSGCIAIALKKNLADAKISAIDVAEQSLITAQENALLNNVEIAFIQQDILKTANSHAKYSIIVSNPPYIKIEEKAAMHQNVLEFEPSHALFVTNENPLIFYNAIADFAIDHLKDNGNLFFEINEYLGKETIDLLLAKGFKNIELRKDMQGKDRMLRCEMNLPIR